MNIPEDAINAAAVAIEQTAGVYVTDGSRYSRDAARAALEAAAVHMHPPATGTHEYGIRNTVWDRVDPYPQEEVHQFAAEGETVMRRWVSPWIEWTEAQP